MINRVLPSAAAWGGELAGGCGSRAPRWACAALLSSPSASFGATLAKSCVGTFCPEEPPGSHPYLFAAKDDNPGRSKKLQAGPGPCQHQDSVSDPRPSAGRPLPSETPGHPSIWRTLLGTHLGPMHRSPCQRLACSLTETSTGLSNTEGAGRGQAGSYKTLDRERSREV